MGHAPWSEVGEDRMSAGEKINACFEGHDFSKELAMSDPEHKLYWCNPAPGGGAIQSTILA